MAKSNWVSSRHTLGRFYNLTLTAGPEPPSDFPTITESFQPVWWWSKQCWILTMSPVWRQTQASWYRVVHVSNRYMKYNVDVIDLLQWGSYKHLVRVFTWPRLTFCCLETLLFFVWLCFLFRVPKITGELCNSQRRCLCKSDVEGGRCIQQSMIGAAWGCKAS